MQKTGVFIVLEGGEGVGKTTQMQKLKEYLPSAFAGREFVFTREPGGSPFAEQIRSLIVGDDARDADGQTMIGLLMASRADHLHHLVLPALKEGKIVVCDRYIASSYAYQVTAQESPELENIFWAYAKLMPVPDATIFFDLDPAEAMKRVDGRNAAKSHFDTRDIGFHTRICEGYKKYFAKSGAKSINIDANQDVGGVWAAVQKAVESILTAP